jgi:dihydroneopterin aldolase
MFTIQLTGLKFFSFHGIHEEEKDLGTQFELNVSVSFPEQGPIHSLEQTVDYVKIHAVIKQRMNIATALLETVAQDLAQLIHESDNRIKAVEINIKKLHPPVHNFQGAVGVSYKRVF